MDKLKDSKCGIISFWLAFIPIIIGILITIKDVIKPADFTVKPVDAFWIMNFIIVYYLVSLILGIIGVRKKGYKKSLAKTGIIMSGLILLIPIIIWITIFIEMLNR